MEITAPFESSFRKTLASLNKFAKENRADAQPRNGQLGMFDSQFCAIQLKIFVFLPSFLCDKWLQQLQKMHRNGTCKFVFETLSLSFLLHNRSLILGFTDVILFKFAEISLIADNNPRLNFNT